jgi:hypothetical protein
VNDRIRGIPRKNRRRRMRSAVLYTKAVDKLAEDGLYVFDAYQTSFTRYDVSGYRRIRRTETSFGQYKPLDLKEEAMKHVKPRRNCRLRVPYLFLLTGFRRGRMFAADEIGRTLASAGIGYADGPGNGLLESSMITRKYGIRSIFQVPDGCSTRHYLDDELHELSHEFGKALDSEIDFLRKLGRITGADYLADPHMLWVLVEHDNLNPFGLFVANYRRIPKRIAKTFKAETGHKLTFRNPRTNKDRLVRAEFWAFVRHRYDVVQATKAVELRKRFRGIVTSNVHFDSIVQYGEWGEVYDIPCVGIRPAIANDPDVWNHWVGYATRLVADATQKAPIVSIRTNLGAAGTKKVPTAATTEYWHSQAVRNGVRGFAFWTLDFPGDTRDSRNYLGMIPANPDPSTRPQERWNSLLAVASTLNKSRVFIPPRSDMGIFVNLFGSSVKHWRHVFATYCLLAIRKVFCNFITDENIMTKKIQLGDFKLVIIPELAVVRSAVIRALEQYAEKGGHVLVANAYDMIVDQDLGRGLADSLFTYGRRLHRPSSKVLFPSHEIIRLRRTNAQYCLPVGGGSAAAKYQEEDIPAIVDRRIGSGVVRLVGFDMFCDVADRAYVASFLDKFARDCGCKDSSWVFDVNIDNVSNITGRLKRDKAPFSRDLEGELPRFLYADGDP